MPGALWGSWVGGHLLMSEVPLYSVLLFAKVSQKQILLSATERRGKNLKSFEEFRLKAKAKIWRWLSYVGNICSTAVATTIFAGRQLRHDGGCNSESDTGLSRQLAAGGLCGLFQCYVVSFSAVWSVSVQCGHFFAMWSTSSRTIAAPFIYILRLPILKIGVNTLV